MRSDEFIDLYKQLEDELEVSSAPQSNVGIPAWFLNTSTIMKAHLCARR